MENEAPFPAIKVGIAGVGAIGGAIAKALIQGIDGYHLEAISDIQNNIKDIPNVDFETLVKQCDLLIEALPPTIVPNFMNHVFPSGKEIIMLSSCALLLYPDIIKKQKQSSTKIRLATGALAGLDGVMGMQGLGLRKSSIKSTKKPNGFHDAPYIQNNSIDLDTIKEKQIIFRGNAIEAATGFPANVNVAATLSFAGLGPENTTVEIWADPNIGGNRHEIYLESDFSTLTLQIQNTPDPENPKTSMLAAQSVISILKKQANPISIF